MKRKTSISSLLGSMVTGFLVSFGVAAAVVGHSLFETANRTKELEKISSAQFEIMSPHGRPTPGQAAINLAMQLYRIKIPGKIHGPYFDSKLEDRGLTVRNGVTSEPAVYVGPEAFTSWSMLGSTLAHEIEIHCRQNFLAIHFQNLAGFSGTSMAEREAYRYELANSKRFGIDQYEQDLIRSTMTYFYPEEENSLMQRMTPVRTWLDHLAAIGFKGLNFN